MEPRNLLAFFVVFWIPFSPLPALAQPTQEALEGAVAATVGGNINRVLGQAEVQDFNECLARISISESASGLHATANAIETCRERARQSSIYIEDPSLNHLKQSLQNQSNVDTDGE